MSKTWPRSAWLPEQHGFLFSEAERQEIGQVWDFMTGIATRYYSTSVSICPLQCVRLIAPLHLTSYLFEYHEVCVGKVNGR